MGSQSTDRLSSTITAFILALSAALILLSAFQLQHRDTDIFWALKSGEWIAQNGWIPVTDPFSYTFEGRPWIDFTWGFQIIAHLFFTYLGGWTGLFFLQIIVTGAAFTLIYLNAKLLTRERAWLASVLILVVFACSHSRLFIRPHLFAYLFISAYFLLLNLYEERGGIKYLIILFPLQALWVNIHSSAVLGVFILGAYASGGVIDIVRKGRYDELLQGRLLRLVAASVVVPMASLINPYGLKLAVFPFVHQAADKADALKHIGEWIKIPVHELFFYFYPEPIDFFSFRVMAVVVVAALVLNLRRIRARDLIILAGAIYMAISHVRWVSLFAYFAVAIIAANLGPYLEERSRRDGRSERGFKWASIAVGLLVAFFVTAEYAGSGARENYGLGIKRGAFPEGTVQFMNREGIKGNIFNEYIFGGYLSYSYTNSKVFIDGRTPTVYSPYFFWTSRLVEDPVMWRRLVDEHSIDMALIKLEVSHCGSLWKDPEWKAVYFDDVSALFLKDTRAFAGLIKRWGLKGINPCADADRYELPEDRAGLLALREELIRYMAPESGGESFARPHRLLGLVDTALEGEHLEEAVRELKRAVGIKDDAYSRYDLGLALGKLQRYDESIEAFRAAVKLKDGYKDALLSLGLIYYEVKDYNNSKRTLEEYFAHADDASAHLAYKTHGIACFNLGRYDLAEASLRRAAYTAKDNSERSDAYYNLGNTLLEAGDINESLRYYALAIEAEPGYLKVLKELARRLDKQGKAEMAKMIRELLPVAR